MPSDPNPAPVDEAAAPEPVAEMQPRGLRGRATSLLLAFFCFELGVFLTAFPWVSLWEHNYFSSLSPQWRELWINPYFRGAISGLGLANLYISFVELWRSLRPSKAEAPQKPPPAVFR